jgi:hypothetical protein
MTNDVRATLFWDHLITMSVFSIDQKTSRKESYGRAYKECTFLSRKRQVTRVTCTYHIKNIYCSSKKGKQRVCFICSSKAWSMMWELCNLTYKGPSSSFFHRKTSCHFSIARQVTRGSPKFRHGQASQFGIKNREDVHFICFYLDVNIFFCRCAFSVGWKGEMTSYHT